MRNAINDHVRKMNKNFNYNRIEDHKKRDPVLKSLPEPLKRYLMKINIERHSEIHTVRLKQKGVFKMKPNGSWKNFTARQYVNTKQDSFIWNAKIKIWKMFGFDVVDQYFNQKGRLTVKLLSLFKIVDEYGPELDHGELLRYICECMWYPNLFLDKRFEIIRESDDSIRLLGNIHGYKVDILVLFDQDGLIREFKTKRWYTNNEGKNFLKDWSGHIKNYEEINGIYLPTFFKATWHLESGDYCYIKGNVTELDFNNPVPYKK